MLGVHPNGVTYQGWKVVNYGELHENLVAGGCTNEDTTEVNGCGLVFAAVRDRVQTIARVVRADIRYGVQKPLRKSCWGYRSGAVTVGRGIPEPPWITP